MHATVEFSPSHRWRQISLESEEASGHQLAFLKGRFTAKSRTLAPSLGKDSDKPLNHSAPRSVQCGKSFIRMALFDNETSNVSSKTAAPSLRVQTATNLLDMTRTLNQLDKLIASPIRLVF